MFLLATGIAIAMLIVQSPPNYHRTKHFEFSLPNNWHCEQTGRETICNAASKPPFNSIIIFGAKHRNKEDNLDNYEQHLLTAREYQTPDGQTVNSKILQVKREKIGNYLWVDGLHFESEVPNYYTRYLATNTAQLGILITFSYHLDAPEEIIEAFATTIKNLKIYQQPSSYR